MIYGVEVGHLYRHEIEAGALNEKWAKRLRLDYEAVPAWVENPVFQVFVDDYPDQYEPYEREDLGKTIAAVGSTVGVDVSVVAFESDCADAAEELAENLPHHDYWLVQNGDGHRRSTQIRDPHGAWSCPALSAIWTLARLGYEPYLDALARQGVMSLDTLAADRCLTVLPTKYIDIEASVIHILRELRKPRVKLSRINYVFA